MEGVKAWIDGYRLGHDGKPPDLSAEQLEHELNAVELASTTAAEAPDLLWLWHIQGWTAGQAAALFEMNR